MSQVSSWAVANGGGAAVRAAMNGLFGAIQTSSSGAAAPSPTAAGMLWWDSSSSPAVLKIRNQANTAWVSVAPETVPAKTVRGNSGASAAAEAALNMTTLATMLGFAQSLTAPYYQTLPSGLMIQWGISGSIAAGGGTAISFAASFPTAAHGAIATPITVVNNTSVFSVGVRALTTSGAILTNNSGTSGAFTGFWIAFGN